MVPFRVPDGCDPASGADLDAGPLPITAGSSATVVDFFGRDDDSRILIEMLVQAVFETGPGGFVTEVSPTWLAYTGQTAEEAMGNGWIAAIHPDDRERVAAARAHATRDLTSLNGEYRLRRADGGWCWTNMRAMPVLGPDGEIVKWVGMNIDISARRDAEERYRLVAQATNDIIWDFDVATGIVTWNDALASHFGHHLESNRASKRWWVKQIHPEDRARVVARATQAHDGALGLDRWTNEYRFARADGSYAHVLDRGQLVRDMRGQPVRAIGAMLDLSEKRHAEAELRLGEERLRLAVAASGLGISDYDARTDMLHWSNEMRQILGVSADEPADGATTLSLVHPDDREELIELHRRARDGDFSHQYQGVRRIYRKNDGALRWVSTHGQPVRDESGQLLRIIITLKDVTEEKTAQDRIQWTATHDAVTGLLNRAAFQSALDQALAAARRKARPLALLLVDLDNFKQINDKFGHHAGDMVLRAFGERIGAALPPGGLLARYGGDEFALILPGMTAEAAARLAADFLTLFRRPFAIDGAAVDLRASVGVAGFSDHGNTAEELLKSADIALYSAKGAGRATVSLFHPAMRATLRDHASMLTQARNVVDNAWTQPFYQPKIAFNSGRVLGFEALFRWRHPHSGLQNPATIAHAFDDFELAAMLGEAMVEAVLADVRRWQDAGIEVGRVAINASAAEFRNPGYAERLLARLAAHGVPPTALELEITETAFLGDSDGLVLHALETLRAAGMTIALDDFGTGFSSLAHLRHFPVDTLKIDKSFVAGIPDRADDRAIVEVVLRLGEALGLTTVAEGVETEAQATFLRGRGCRLAQGFLFSRPLPAGEVAGFVAERGPERRRSRD